MARVLPINGGKVVIDDSDWPRVNALTWRVAKNGYVYSAGLNILLHRYLLGSPEGLYVDHINGNPLDNRRANLRPATSQQSQRNTRKRRDCSSQYKGVSWRRSDQCWEAYIYPDRSRHVHLGRFSEEERAARAYDDAARKAFGQFATLNFPRPGERSASTGLILAPGRASPPATTLVLPGVPS